MEKLNLTTIDVQDLDVFVKNFYDLRRDVHVFVEYVKSREVKRAYRTNFLTKTDYNRLVKLMTDPRAVKEIEAMDRSTWVDFVDELALKLEFVSYDTKGQYMGYTSSEPSYPDNYIQFNSQKYNAFLNKPLLEQERLFFNTLVDNYNYCNNEFFHNSLLGQLNCFSSFGCATGVVPGLNFAKSRRFLFNVLAECKSGLWYSTASLVEYLKKEFPYFLIPIKLKLSSPRKTKENRYVNFAEGTERWGRGITISENDPDSFERVEGRYIEHFLENIPLILGYVDLAYSKNINREREPSDYQSLKAFRVNKRFLKFMEGTVDKPKVTVQPNFEIHVESEFYPAQVMAQLFPLTDIVSEDVIIILKLQKKKVLAQLVNNHELEIIKLLTKLSDKPLPQNIVIELQEWTGHTEKFILYEGFGLLEGDEDLAPADPFTFETITPHLRIIRNPQELYLKLEQEELIPLRIMHSDNELKSVTEKARTHFLQKTKKVEKTKQKKELTLTRHVMITLHFPDKTVLNKFNKALLDAHCPVVVNEREQTLTYAKFYEEQFETVIKYFKKDYIIKIEDIKI